MSLLQIHFVLPDNEYLAIIIRAVIIYLFVVIAIRVFGKKELAQLSVTDLVFILLISNAVQNAMVGPDTSLIGGVVAAFGLFVMNFILKFLLYKSKRLSNFLQGNPILLIYKGEIQEHNLRRAEITLDELQAAVREHGVKDVQHVDLAMLEVDGNISIISDDFKNKSSIKTRKKHKFRERLNKI